MSRLLLMRLGVGGAAAAALLTAGGCAERGVASGPPSPPGVGTWLAVGVGATAAALVIAGLLVLPGRRRGGSPVATGLLAIQAGAAAVGSAVVVGAAARSEDLLGRPRDAERAASLLRLTRLDGGDVGFFHLMIGLVAVLGALVVVALALAARAAAGTDRLDRALATGMLAVEAVGCGVSLVLVVLGQRGLPFTIPAAALPLAVLGAVAAWPRSRDDLAAEAPAGSIGYNEPHG